MRTSNGSSSPELETLDQLLGGDMPLSVIKSVFPDDDAFLQGIAGLLRAGDVVLRDEGVEVPRWRLRELFEERVVIGELSRFTLGLTEQGAGRVA